MDEDSSSDEDGNDDNDSVPMAENDNILRMSGQPLWCLAMYATKLNLPLNPWSHVVPAPNGDEGRKSLTYYLKRVSHWQMTCLGPMSDYFYEKHTPYVSKILESHPNTQIPSSEGLETETHKRCPIALHATLLTEISKTLMEKAKQENIGQGTHSKIEEWFSLILHSDLKKIIRGEEKEELVRLKDEHTSSKSDKVPGPKEFPFFDHRTLFIYIAHVVHMECRSNVEYLTSLFPDDVEAKRTQLKTEQPKEAHDNFHQWRTICGRSVHRLFQAGNPPREEIPLPLFEHGTLPTLEDHPGKGKKGKKGTLSIPPVLEIHQLILAKMCEDITKMIQRNAGYKVTKQEKKERKKILCFIESHCIPFLERQIDLLNNRERESRSRLNLTGGEPRDTLIFDDDVFIMGKQSFYTSHDSKFPGTTIEATISKLKKRGICLKRPRT